MQKKYIRLGYDSWKSNDSHKMKKSLINLNIYYKKDVNVPHTCRHYQTDTKNHILIQNVLSILKIWFQLAKL